MVHNGNIPNHKDIADQYDIDLVTQSDTELLVKYIEQQLNNGKSIQQALILLLYNIKGAYSLLIRTNEGVYAVRDRFGVRPLCVGRDEHGYCYSSESVALMGCYPLGDVLRGSVVFCDGLSQRIIHKICGIGPARVCTFEDIYFKNHKSFDVYNKRFQMGYELGLTESSRESEVPIIVCLPNTAISCAEGFAQSSGYVFEKDWIVKESDRRTFILPTDAQRIEACGKAFIVNSDICDHNIILIDDSLVRGNTMKAIISQLRSINVKRIDVRICSPPVVESCQYGIDIPTRNELIAHGRTIDEIKVIIGADSLKYLQRSIVEDVCNRGCTQCFGGDLLW